MCEMTVQSLLGIFVAPEKFHFRKLYDAKSLKYGLAIHRGEQVLFHWAPFTSIDNVSKLVGNILRISGQYGRLAYFSEKKTFLSEWCAPALILTEEEVLDASKAELIMSEFEVEEAFQPLELVEAI